MTDQALGVLREAGVLLRPGLSEAELTRIEHRFGFVFHPSHREFLAAALPTGERWVDWRDDDDAAIAERLQWPIEGVLFDVEHNGYWPRPWGPRPSDAATRRVLAEEELSNVPRLVPIYAHRCIPAGPGPEVAPVLSVHQTDVIYYGTDLLDYVTQEFANPPARRDAGEPARVPFWSDLVYDEETYFSE